MKKVRFKFIILLFITACIISVVNMVNAEPVKILHISSYNKGYQWADDIDNGIRQTLNSIKPDYRVFYMDTKRKNTPEEMNLAATNARNLIKSWNPTVIIVSDDNATELVAAKMKDTKYKFVFTGVNNEPEAYGFPTKNITGVLERPDAKSVIDLLKKLKPNAKKIALLSDNSETSAIIAKQIKPVICNQAGITLIDTHLTNSASDFKEHVKQYQTKADAIFLINFHTLKDNNNKVLSGFDMIHWITKNSKIPEVGLYTFVPLDGGLAASTVNGVLQGNKAGEKTLRIIKGESPASIKIEIAGGNKIFVNTVRAKQLGIKIPQSVINKAILVNK